MFRKTKEKHNMLYNKIVVLRAEVKELKRPTVVTADKQEIAKYSYENDILNFGNAAISIKRQQLLTVDIYINSVRIEYKNLFVEQDTKTYTAKTRRFDYEESVQAAYDRIVELLIDRPVDKAAV